jgi:hypothetical protein
LSSAREQVAVNDPTFEPVGVTVTVAAAATPDVESVVLQPAAGTDPSTYCAPSLTFVTVTVGASLSICAERLAEAELPA